MTITVVKLQCVEASNCGIVIIVALVLEVQLTQVRRKPITKQEG